MKHQATFSKSLWAGLVAALLGASGHAADPGDYLNNASFLTYGYLHNSGYGAETDELLYKFDVFYKVQYLFPHAGSLDASGHLPNPSQAQPLLQKVKNYETANGVVYRVYAWINGQTSALGDLSDAGVRANIVTECKRFVSSSVPGSYVGGSRQFGGVVIDIEPSGNNPALYSNLKTLVVEIKNAFAAIGLSGKKVGVAVHKLALWGHGSSYYWDPSQYYYMGKLADIIVAMTYNSGINTSGADYRDWMAWETSEILRSISGAQWNNDANHPVPTNGVKVFIGVPGYQQASASHNPAIERADHACQGILQGLNNLETAGDTTSKSFFLGASMYAHRGGDLNEPVCDQYIPAGTAIEPDDFAYWYSDWWYWGRDWLDAW